MKDLDPKLIQELVQNSFGIRTTTRENTEAKEHIAALVAEYLASPTSAEKSIFLGPGSTLAFLAAKIAYRLEKQREPISCEQMSIITTNVLAALTLFTETQCDVHLLAGEMDQRYHSIVTKDWQLPSFPTTVVMTVSELSIVDNDAVFSWFNPEILSLFTQLATHAKTLIVCATSEQLNRPAATGQKHSLTLKSFDCSGDKFFVTDRCLNKDRHIYDTLTSASWKIIVEEKDWQ